MSDAITHTAEQAQLVADAHKALSRPVYVCLEEPSDPLMFTPRDPADRGWGGNAEIPGTAPLYRKEYPAWMCADRHPELPCGWYRLEPAKDWP